MGYRTRSSKVRVSGLHKHNAEKPAEPEEISEGADPFMSVEIASDTEDDGNHDSRNVAGSGGDSCSDADAGSDVDVIMEDAPTYDISLDSVVNSEDEDSDPEDDSDVDSKDDDTGPDGEGINIEGEEEFGITESQEGDEKLIGFNHGFNGAGLGVVPPPPTSRTIVQQPQPYSTGCVWTAEDWSCSYDAVFMAFWSLYEQSSTSWRDDWMRYAPDWNGPLGNNFDHLILLANTPVTPRDHAEWFCHYRDRFRDQLSHTDPRSFPRRGQRSTLGLRQPHPRGHVWPKFRALSRTTSCLRKLRDAISNRVRDRPSYDGLWVRPQDSCPAAHRFDNVRSPS
jgi:hypothetical protein